MIKNIKSILNTFDKRNRILPDLQGNHRTLYICSKLLFLRYLSKNNDNL